MRPRTRARAIALVVTAVFVLTLGLHAVTGSPAYRRVPAGQTVVFDVQTKSRGAAPAVMQWLRAGGLAAETIDPRGTVVRVLGTAARVDARLGVVLEEYSFAGRTFHRPRGAVVLPPAIARDVQTVVGLDDKTSVLVQPDVGGRPLDACVSRNACLTRDGVARAFALQPLYDRNILGTGQTVAVVMDGAVDPADLAQFDREAGINGGIDFREIDVDPLQKIDRDGAADARSEATMDVETVHMIAPAAKILYYQSSFAGTGIADAFERIAKEHSASIVTYSVGACDIAPNDDIEQAERRAIADLKRAHITLFTSSGDHGVYGCAANAFGGSGDPDWSIVGSWPADSADVVSVGGTFLRHGADDSYQSEDAWVSPLSNWSTGGGASPTDAAPAWQTGPGFGAAAVAHRQYPDVAAPADPESGWTIVVDRQDDRSSGTSAASPFWAGYAALVRQEAAAAHTGTIPFLAPVLYAVANGPQRASVFHDVVAGSNLHDTAGPGWDDATGLGSPIGAPLADAIVAYLAQHPDAAAND